MVTTSQALDELDKVVRLWRSSSRTVIKPSLHRRANGPNYWWRLQLVEETDDNQPNSFYNQRFEDCVKWTEAQLINWPNCERKSFDMWDFKQRKDAEKFITLFHLSWDQ